MVGLARPLGLLALLVRPALGEEPDGSYGALVDPWLKRRREAVRIGEDQLLFLELHRGELTAAGAADGAPVLVTGEERTQLLLAFPEEAWHPPVDGGAWAAKVRQHAVAAHDEPACAVIAENHFELSVIDVFMAMRVSPPLTMFNIGGLYGGRHGEGEDAPDDPVVELLRWAPTSRVLCWNCEGVAEVTRVGSLATQFDAREVDLLSAEFQVPPEFLELDMLRLDTVPAGQSCQVLKRLLRAGVQPRVVTMLVLSQVPPPFKFVPLILSTRPAPPPPLFSCSLAAAADVLAPHGLFLARLTGPYALFVARRHWPEQLPVSDLDCFRRAAVWGHADLPIAAVREWLFSAVESALPRLWGNITALYAAAGQPNAPFTLAV